MIETKQIIFEGRTYEVPSWVKWVARDKDLCVLGFATKPYIEDDDFQTEDARLFVIIDAPDWRDSLTKV